MKKIPMNATETELVTASTEMLIDCIDRVIKAITKGAREHYKALHRNQVHYPTQHRITMFEDIKHELYEREGGYTAWKNYCNNKGFDPACTAWDCLA